MIRLKSNIFIPEKINVGFQSRGGTYTGKLAYIIYFDEKGKLRKETSWNSWRDKSIENIITKNEPTSGFVLNKKAGGYDTGWNHRQTYVRVYDPRGFEFEINVANLLYILDNTNSIKGKGLEGDFVYGWEGKDIILIPVESPDYIQLSNLNKLIHEKNFIKVKDLKIGATYLTKSNEEYVYMGRFDEYYSGKKNEKTSFYFKERNRDGFQLMKSISGKLISEISSECVEDYSELMDDLECYPYFSPINTDADEYAPLTFEEFTERADGWSQVFDFKQRRIRVFKSNSYNQKPRCVLYGNWSSDGAYFESLEAMYETIKPTKRVRYLKNGRTLKESVD